MAEATMTPTKAMAITREPERYTVQERKDAKKVLAKVGSEGADFTENPKNAPVSMPKPRPKNMSRGGKATMMRGGMANKKEHMYAAGGMVNDGLKALKKASPKAYNKITQS